MDLENPQDIPQKVAKKGDVHSKDFENQLPAEDYEGGPLLNSRRTERHPSLRNAFLRRVYCILSLQLSMTVLISLACMTNIALRSFVIVHSQAMMWCTFIPTIIMIFGLSCVKNVYPWNLVLLTAFTFAQSCMIGTICAIYYASGLGLIVAQAAILTLAVFLCLTTYCLVSKRDFSFLGGFLGAGLLLLIGWGLLNLIFGWHASWVYSLFGALLFCGYILFDTYQISQRFQVDDYILACIELYLDIINLFLFILQLLSNRNE